MDLGIRGKIALVTGASQGLGRAVAEALAREGADLAIAARGEDRLGAAAAEIRRAHGVRVTPFTVDLSRADGIPSSVEAVTKACGRVDVLVTNAGGPPAGTFEEIDEAAWRRSIDLTLMSVVGLCRAIVPGMRARRFGRIVHLTSVSVKQPLERLVLSNALRAAVVGLSKTLANEVARDGVTVNCVAPGFIATERLAELAASAAKARGATEDAVRASWLASIPVGRLGHPPEVGDLVAFLASDRAAYVNGAVIAIDGGLARGLL